MSTPGLLQFARQLNGWGARGTPQRDKRSLSVYAGGEDGSGPNYFETPQSIADLEGMRTSRAGRPAWQFADGYGLLCGPGDYVGLDFDHQVDRRAVNAAMVLAGVDPASYAWVEDTSHDGKNGYHLILLVDCSAWNGTGSKNREGIYGGRIECHYRKHLITLKPSRFINGLPTDAPARVTPEQLAAIYDALTLPESNPPKATESRPYSPPASPAGTDRAARYALAALEGIRGDIEGAKEGQRNNILFSRARRAGQFVGIGLLSEEDARSALEQAGLAAGLAEHEVSGTVKSGLKRGKTESPALPDFDKDVASEHRASEAQSLSQNIASHFGLFCGAGFPRTLAWAIMGLHKLDLPYHIESHLPFFKVYHAAHTLMVRGLLTVDTPFSASDFKRLAADARIKLSRHDLEQGIEQACAIGVCRGFCEKVNRSIRKESDQLKISQNLGGRPAACYCFDLEHLSALRSAFSRLYWEAAYNGSAPSDIFPGWFNTSEEDTDLLNEIRQPVYELFADQRQRAQASFEESVRRLDRALDSIRRGTYKSLDLPDVELGRNGSYHEAVAMSVLMDNKGTIEKAYPRFERLLGVSKPTVTRILQNIGAITVERAVTLPAERWMPHHHVIGRDPARGTITIRGYSAAQLEEYAEPEAVDKYRQNCEQQGARAVTRRPARSLPQCSSEPVLTIPPVHSQEFLTMQIQPDFLPGIEDIPVWEVDRETGETLRPLEPADRVNLLLEKHHAGRQARGLEPSLDCDTSRADPLIEFAESLGGCPVEPPAPQELACSSEPLPEAAPLPPWTEDIHRVIGNTHTERINGTCSGCGRENVRLWKGDRCVNCAPKPDPAVVLSAGA